MSKEEIGQEGLRLGGVFLFQIHKKNLEPVKPWVLVGVQFFTSLIDNWNGLNDNRNQIYKKANWQRVSG